MIYMMRKHSSLRATCAILAVTMMARFTRADTIDEDMLTIIEKMGVRRWAKCGEEHVYGFDDSNRKVMAVSRGNGNYEGRIRFLCWEYSQEWTYPGTPKTRKLFSSKKMLPSVYAGNTAPIPMPQLMNESLCLFEAIGDVDGPMQLNSKYKEGHLSPPELGIKITKEDPKYHEECQLEDLLKRIGVRPQIRQVGNVAHFARPGGVGRRYFLLKGKHTGANRMEIWEIGRDKNHARYIATQEISLEDLVDPGTELMVSKKFLKSKWITLADYEKSSKKRRRLLTELEKACREQ